MTAALAAKPVFFNGPIGRRELVSYVDPYPGSKNSDRLYGRDVAPCIRCGGSGIYSDYHGLCYRCGGNGREHNGVSVGTLRKHAKADAYYSDYAEEYAAHVAAENAAEAAHYLAVAVAQDHEYALAINAKIDADMGYLAEVGEKVADIEIVVKVAKYIAGSYNRSSSMFIVAESAAGHAITLFGSAASVMSLSQGDRAVITTGRVKAHDEYDGVSQTKLSHVKVQVIEPNEEK